MRKHVLIPVANGGEEIETLAVADLLRRAGAEVTLASVTNDLTIVAATGTTFLANTELAKVKDKTFDLIIIPGGMPGAEHLRDSKLLTEMLIMQKKENRLYAAICAAPVVVLQHHKLTENLPITCHPSLADKCQNFTNERVVVSGNCITSQAPGTAIEFALKLIEILLSKNIATQVAKAIVY
jgi:4-methyl-5(b-hydroxyethyl)-thiazole monophosphate biosynthesis